MNKEKIAMVSYSLIDQDTRIKRYVDSLKSNYDIDIYALKKKSKTSCIQDNKDNVTVYYISTKQNKNTLIYITSLLNFFIKVFYKITINNIKSKYRIIHFHNFPDFLIFSLLIPKLSGCKIILDMHEISPEFYMQKSRKPYNSIINLLKLQEKISIRFCDHVIFCSDICKNVVNKRLQKLNKPSSVIYNLPDLNYFILKKNRNKEFINIVFTGTISFLNGVHTSINAVKEILNEDLKCQLHIYGKFSDNKYKEYLKELISENKLKKHIFIHDYVQYSNLNNILNKYNIGVNPKTYGVYSSLCFNTKIPEYLANGIPVLTPETESEKYHYNKSEVTFFKIDDAHDLAQQIISLYQNENLYRKKILSGYNYVKKNNWSIEKSKYLKTIQNLLNMEAL